VAVHSHDHGAHDHDGHHDHHRAAPGSHPGSLIVALLLTLCFAGVEALAGWWSGSLALLSDAAHMITDASALGLAAGAAWLARRPPSLLHSYGLLRAEVLAALVNSVLMLVLIGFILHEAIERFGSPRDIAGGAVVLVAGVGLIVNLGVAWILHRGEQTLNTRAALLHVLGDALGSVAAIVSGIIILASGWTPIDPLMSLFVAALIGVSALQLLREVVHVLMEGVPLNIKLDAVGRDLARIPGVLRVHDLHVWTLSSGTLALSAHLEMSDLEHWPVILDAARKTMAQQHGIHHVTLQPEVLTASPLVRSPRPPSSL